MKLATGALSFGPKVRINLDLIRHAEKLGFDSAWTAEAWGNDAVTTATWIAAKTETINVGTAIMQMPARTPAMTAMTATTLNQLSEGRFKLGLGPSGPQVVEGWHGVPYGKPRTRTREYAGNSRLYTDYSFMTCDDSISDDVNKLFQQLTGMGKALKIKKLFHAPFTLHSRLMSLIEREAGFGKKGRIIMKFNALTEPQLIKALYRASQAGVKIDLIIRGICCLRPEVPGLSDNIRVSSIIGRFLEHTRVYYFGNNRRPDVYCSSADGMERNLLSRVEVAFPIEDPALVARMREDLDTYLADNCQSWALLSDGSYVQKQPAEGEERLASQLVLLERLTGKS